MITLLEGGRLAEARALSHTIAIIVKRVFAAVGKIQAGNAFANANKALDHARAYGTVACLKVPPPMLHAGVRLPIRAVQAAREALLDGGMSKATGYLPASPPEGVR